MPAYDNVLQRYLPNKVFVKDGKKCPYMVRYHLNTVAGMGAVFWNGSGGMKTFHKSTPLTPMLASWQIQDEKVGLWSEGEIAPMDVYEDPRWQTHTQVDTEKHILSEGKVERLVDRHDARKMYEKGHRT